MLPAEVVEAMNFVLYLGHLGRREPVVQPATKRSFDLREPVFVLEKEKGGEITLRRIIMVLSVALL